MKTNYFQATDNDSLKPGENKLWGRGVVSNFSRCCFVICKYSFVIEKKSSTSSSHTQLQMFQVAYTYNTTNSAECRLFGLSELNFIDELRKEQASQQQHYAHYKYYDFV